MPFNKENARELGKKGGETKGAKAQAWDNIVGWLVGEGGERFKEILMTIASGGEVTKGEKEFLEHYKDLLEFHQPKLARNENKQVGDININIGWEE